MMPASVTCRASMQGTSGLLCSRKAVPWKTRTAPSPTIDHDPGAHQSGGTGGYPLVFFLEILGRLAIVRVRPIFLSVCKQPFFSLLILLFYHQPSGFCKNWPFFIIPFV